MPYDDYVFAGPPALNVALCTLRVNNTFAKRTFPIVLASLSLLVERKMGQDGLILTGGCVRSKEIKNKTKNKPEKSATLKIHYETHNNPATATTSSRRVVKHVTRVRPHSPASTDSGFGEISPVQLSQSVKMTNVTHTYTHRPTN